MGLPNPSRETKFSGASRDKEILILPVQLTTCRIGNLTGLILTFAIYYVTIHTTYNRAIQSCPPSHSMSLALILPMGERVFVRACSKYLVSFYSSSFTVSIVSKYSKYSTFFS